MMKRFHKSLGQLAAAGALGLACFGVSPAHATAKAMFDCRNAEARHDAPAMLDRLLAKPSAGLQAMDLRDHGHAVCKGQIRHEILTILNSAPPSTGKRSPVSHLPIEHARFELHRLGQ
jgi:hypothetical protein